MSLKCSLLGHRFGETSVERDREEDGTEVVITITELETCTRCGETRVVSENKEVTTLETPEDDIETADAPAGDDEDDADAGGNGIDLETDAGADDAEILEDDGAESTAQAEARTSKTTIPDAESEPEPDVGEEDAVIIGDEDDSAADGDSTEAVTGADENEGTSGEWPEEPDESDDGTDDDSHGGVAEWPDDESIEPEIGDARQSRDESPSSGPTDDDRSTGEWPEQTQAPDSGGALGIDLEADEAGVTVPEGMFKCSECGFTTEVESSSLRQGDFCPECRRGTLLQDGDAEE